MAQTILAARTGSEITQSIPSDFSVNKSVVWIIPFPLPPPKYIYTSIQFSWWFHRKWLTRGVSRTPAIRMWTCRFGAGAAEWKCRIYSPLSLLFILFLGIFLQEHHREYSREWFSIIECDVQMVVETYRMPFPHLLCFPPVILYKRMIRQFHEEKQFQNTEQKQWNRKKPERKKKKKKNHLQR